MTDSNLRAKPADVPVERVAWADYARGIGILLVVVGHTLRGLVTSGIIASGPLQLLVDAWIYAFHMPLIFFVAGLFAADAGKKRPLQFFGDKARSIVYPYLVWSILQTLVESVFSRYTNTPTSPAALLHILHEPVKQFWFFYALLLIASAFYVLRRAGVPFWGCLVFALVGRHLALNDGLSSWGILNVAASELVYFALGMIGARHAGRISTSLEPAGAWLLIGGSFVLVTMSVLHVVPTQPLVTQWSELGTALAGIAGTAALATLLARWRGLDVVRTWGVNSLQIFVAHTLASASLRIFLRKFLGVDDALVHLVLGTVAGIAGPMLLVRICERFGFRYAFAFPKRARPAQASELSSTEERRAA